jgi:hypothetical protein
MRELEVLVRNRDFRPRAGVEVELRLPGGAVQWNVTGADGIAGFEIPDIANGGPDHRRRRLDPPRAATRPGRRAGSRSRSTWQLLRPV